MEDYIRNTMILSSRLMTKTAEEQSDMIEKIALTIISRVKQGGKLLIFGNGGSAADAQHMQAELTHQFEIERREAIPCIALTTNTSVLTAIGNDWGFDEVFSRQVENIAGPDDVVLGISTSGNSENVKKAFETAAKQGAKTIGLLGKDGGCLKGIADLSLVVDSKSTARIQETHLAVEHILCALIEREIAKDAQSH